MLYRKLRNQWLLMPIFIMLMFSGSILLKRNHQINVYYVKTTMSTTEAASFSLVPAKHVTKSLAELGKMDDINKYTLFLNKIPNCGAEVIIFLLQKMQGPNNYRHVRLKGGSTAMFTKIQQEEFVDELYSVMRDEAVPVSFDRQLYFINFTSFDKQSPTFINLIREPADKAISRSRYNNKQRDNDDLIQCVIQGKTNCNDKRVNPHDLTIPYFCGHDPKCFSNNQWAMQMAKINVEKYYPVVGVLEELNTTLEIFEHKVPYFFKGVQDLYKKNMIDKLNRNKGSQPQTKTRKHLKRILAKEYEFYNWVKRRLFKQLQMFYGDHISH
ncbi:uronyl 2-sulfotransferase [Asbolus verrucosus]|uniref:Uronyl 2-sulfotransferase n=1 Tax=Asbolus verrucosus TaxID=1661398 RepID=A0A482WB70_ASBVE|nr:uronyl 2-sulfotransferase [Asbolus verrucosus]